MTYKLKPYQRFQLRSLPDAPVTLAAIARSTEYRPQRAPVGLRREAPSGTVVPCPGNADGGGHRWRLESPSGPRCAGVCRHCGETRTYPTSSEASFWERTEEEG